MRQLRIVPLLALVSLAAAAGCSGGGGAGGKDRDPVHVSVVDYVLDAPFEGAPVVVTGDDGIVDSSQVTDATGLVDVVVPEGGMVTVYTAVALDFQMTSAVDPPEGSTFLVGYYGSAQPTPSPVPTVAAGTLTITPASVPLGTASISAYYCSASDGGGPADTLSVSNSGCQTAGTDNLYVLAYDANDAVLGSLELPIVSGSTATITDAIPASTPDIHTLNLVHVPAAATLSRVATTAFGGRTRLEGVFIDSTTDISSPVGYHPGSIDSIESYGVINLQPSASSYVSMEFLRRDASATTVTFDVNDMVFVFADPTDVSDPTHPMLSWSLVGTGSHGTHGNATFFWDTATTTTVWNVYFPPDRADTTLRVPDVPADLTTWTLDATDQFQLGYVTYFQGTAPDFATVLGELDRGYSYVDPGATTVAQSTGGYSF